jgi:hypothetical protein
MKNLEHSFAAGWNARCDGEELDKLESADWRQGWRMAEAYPDEAFRKFNEGED